MAYCTDFSGVAVYLHPHKNRDICPSVFTSKCKAAIYLPYTFGITSFCTRLLSKPCLSLWVADWLETEASKILSSQFISCLADSNMANIFKWTNSWKKSPCRAKKPETDMTSSSGSHQAANWSNRENTPGGVTTKGLSHFSCSFNTYC